MAVCQWAVPEVPEVLVAVQAAECQLWAVPAVVQAAECRLWVVPEVPAVALEAVPEVVWAASAA